MNNQSGYEAIRLAPGAGRVRLFGRSTVNSLNNYHPPRYPNLVNDETLPSLWRWLRAETNMERSECTLPGVGRVARINEAAVHLQKNKR